MKISMDNVYIPLLFKTQGSISLSRNMMDFSSRLKWKSECFDRINTQVLLKGFLLFSTMRSHQMMSRTRWCYNHLITTLLWSHSKIILRLRILIFIIKVSLQLHWTKWKMDHIITLFLLQTQTKQMVLTNISKPNYCINQL